MSEKHGRQMDRKDGGEGEVLDVVGVGDVAVVVMGVMEEEEMAGEKSIDNNRINENLAVSLRLESEHPLIQTFFPLPPFFPTKSLSKNGTKLLITYRFRQV